MDARPRFYAPRPFMNSVSQTTRDFGLCVSLGGRGAHSSSRSSSSSSGKTTGGREKKRLGKKRKNRNKKKKSSFSGLRKKKTIFIVYVDFVQIIYTCVRCGITMDAEMNVISRRRPGECVQFCRKTFCSSTRGLSHGHNIRRIVEINNLSSPSAARSKVFDKPKICPRPIDYSHVSAAVQKCPSITLPTFVCRMGSFKKDKKNKNDEVKNSKKERVLGIFKTIGFRRFSTRNQQCLQITGFLKITSSVIYDRMRTFLISV